MNKRLGFIVLLILLSFAFVRLLKAVPVTIDETYLNGTFLGNISQSTKVGNITFNVTNATALTIKLNSIFDIFLYDDFGNIVGSNISSDRIYYSFIKRPNAIYEARFYSPSLASFKGNITLFSLNSSTGFLNFGDLNYTSNTSTVSFDLNNTRELGLLNVKEDVDLFYQKQFVNSVNSKNFTFLFPQNFSKVNAVLKWNSTDDFDMKLLDLQDFLLADENKKTDLANISELNFNKSLATIDYAPLGSSGNDKILKIVVTGSGTYNLTIKLYSPNFLPKFNSSYANFVGIRDFNSAVDNETVKVNLSVPFWAIDGTYNGSMKYSDLNGNEMSIPLGFTLAVPMLVVNGSSNAGTLQVKQNPGYTFDFVTNVSVNNTGNLNLTIDEIENSSFLFNGNKNISILQVSGISPGDVIEPNSAKEIAVTFSINTSDTEDELGIYSGWLFVNSSNGHPYKTSNLTLEVNLTSDLIVNISSVSSVESNDLFVNPGKNFTVNISVYFINGTSITGLGESNFTNPKLQISFPFPVGSYERNIGGLSDFSEISTNLYQFNLTANSSMPGGNYSLKINVSDITGRNSMVGSFGVGNSSNAVVVNASGLFLSADKNSTGFLIGSSSSFAVFLSNYGPVADSFVISSNRLAGLCAANPTPSPSIFVSGYNFSNLVNTTIVISSPQFVGPCAFDFVGNSSSLSPSFNNYSISAVVSTSGGGGIGIFPFSNITITGSPKTVYVEQGLPNQSAVNVKNTGILIKNITLNIAQLNSSWFTVSESGNYISANQTAIFVVNFLVPNTTKIADYSGIFSATSLNVSDMFSFGLRVLPNFASKIQINVSLAQIKQDYILLGTDLDQVKTVVDGNTAIVDTLYAGLGGNITVTDNQIKNNDYFGAYQNLPVLQSQLNKTRTELLILNQTTKTPVALPPISYWLILGSVFVGIVIVIYIIWPSKVPYSRTVRKKSFGPSQKGEDTLKRIKERIFGKKKTKSKEVRIVIASRTKNKKPSK